MQRNSTCSTTRRAVPHAASLDCAGAVAPGGVKRSGKSPLPLPFTRRYADPPWPGLHSPAPVSATRSCAKFQVAGIRRGGILVPCNRAGSLFCCARAWSPAVACGRLRSPAVACGRLRSPAGACGRLRSPVAPRPDPNPHFPPTARSRGSSEGRGWSWVCFVHESSEPAQERTYLHVFRSI